MKPEISFLIATRNRGRIIGETIDSLIAQENENWEAIIVDDHGSDDTEKIIAGYNDSRLKYFRLPDSHGMGACCARNFAAAEARADIVAIIDSDDIAYPNRVDVTLEAFKKHPSSDVFYAHIDIWEEETGIVRERKLPFTPFDLEKLKKDNFIPHSTVAMKRLVLLNNPYNSFFRLAEDYELTTRLAESGKKFCYSREKILKYRVSREGVSIGVDKKEILKNYSLLIQMLRGWIKYDYQVIEKINQLEKARENGKN